MPIELTFYEVINSITMVILTVVGIVLFYKINGGEKGENFLSRYLSIGFVTVIRSLVFVLIPVMIVYGITLGVVYGENIPEKATLYDVIMGVVYFLGFIYLNIKYLKNLLKK